MALFNGNNYTLADFLANGGFGYAEIWEQFWDDVLAELTARSSGVGASASAAAGSATAAATSAAASLSDRLLSETARTAVQALLGQVQTARDGAAADRVLAQSYIGTATNMIVPAINCRLASAWDATGQPTAYALSGVAAVHRYDTRLDWDRGAWRRGKQARASSWFNEALNTSTRGAKREFPVVALIAITQTVAVIYDAHDLDSSGSPRMWMVFSAGNGALAFSHPVWTYAGVAAAEGQLCFPNNGSGGIGLFTLDFVKDAAFRTHTGGKVWRCNLANRNVGVASESVVSTSTTLTSGVVHSVDMRLLPAAPVDPITRLPIPTIAVATGGTSGGLSVIHPTGLVATITKNGGFSRVRFLDDQRLLGQYGGTNSFSIGLIPFTTMADGAWSRFYIDGSTTPIRHVGGVVYGMLAAAPGAIGHDNGLTLIAEDKAAMANSLVAHITKSHATGWMPGDTRLAAICEGAGANGASGGELVSNGTFDTSTTGWTSLAGAEAATLSVVSGALRVAATGAWGAGSQTVTTVVGQAYTVAFDVVALAGAIATIRVRDAGGDVSMNGPGGADSATLGRRTLTFVARQTSTNICLFANSGSADFDNVSCRKSGMFSDAVTQHTPVNDSLSSAGSWTLSAVTANTGAGTFDWAASGGYADLIMSSLQVGQQYAVTFVLSSWTSGTLECRCPSNVPDGAAQATAAGTFTKYFTATAASMTLRFIATATLTASLTSVRVDMLAADRSYKGKGLIVNGTLTRSPVAAESDLYVLSGFSANDYLEQPPNPDLDTGTGDFCIPFLFGITSGGYMFYRARPDLSGGAYWYIAIAGSSLTARISDGVSATIDITGTSSVIDGALRLGHLVRRGQSFELWVSGIKEATVASPSMGSLSNATATLRAGCRQDGSSPATGAKLALLRFSAYAPTPAQIARQASDEMAAVAGKMMLGDTSSSVQSLALDEDTGVLAVGTGDGVSQFAGLRRVGRLTHAAGTAFTVASVTSVSAGGGTVLVGTANEAGVVSDLMPIKDDLRQAPAPANGNDVVLTGVTTDATPLDLGKIFVGEAESVQVEADIQATEYGQTPVEGASYTVRARVRRNLCGNVQVVGSAYHVTVDETTATMDATVTVDTTAQAFAINVTGKASTRLIWRAVVRLNWISETRNAAA